MTPSLQVSGLTLRVPHVGRSVDFYTNKMGFILASQSEEGAELATSVDASPILTLTERRGAPHVPRDSAGLFHAALLLPSRSALGAWLKFAAAHGLDFEGFSDHGVSEAIYLSDPDGNGLEFYADRPREAWPFAQGELAMATRPLALKNLLAEAAPPTNEPLAGAVWGHVHLRVTDLDRSEEFYSEQLGLEVTQRSYPGARFLAADGYHHHVGLNTWGNPHHPLPPGALGLAELMVTRAGAVAESRLADPDGIRVRVVPSLVAAV